MAERLAPSRHRPDIEGLRAVAVLAVLLFHLDVAGFSGGFVGVDVFFVISGYLLGGIVLREHVAGCFSLAGFFVRRAKRLVPVLLVVLAVCTAAAAILLLPAELEDYAASLIAALVFGANIYFYQGQFEYSESGEVPLLHLWTLGVEWQFYLLLPFLLLGLLRLGWRWMWAGLVMTALLSAAVSLAIPQASFFLLPARIWEFLAGVLTAITTVPLLGRRVWRELLGLVGLIMIGAAVWMFDTSDPFPGWRALIPCAGAAAIILAGQEGDSLIGRLLALPGVTYLGRISYSLYLWHWPVIVFLLLGLPATQLDWRLQLTAAALSLALAALSARFIEQPGRRREMSLARLALVGGASAAALALAAGAMIASSGWPARFSARALQHAAALDYPIDDVFRSGRCFIHHRSQRLDETTCMLPDDGRPQVLVLGDSHAAMLAHGLRAKFPGSAISQLTAAGCRPVTGVRPERYFFCHEMMDDAYQRRIAPGRYDLIVLAGYWEDGDLAALEASLDQFAGKQQAVLVVGPFAAFELFVPRLLAIGEEREDATLVDRFLKADRRGLDARMAAISARRGAAYFSPLRAQCDPRCEVLSLSGEPLIVDDAHLTAEASAMLAARISNPALVR